LAAFALVSAMTSVSVKSSGRELVVVVVVVG